jgi:glycerol-3-phosphate acyltransferase PlsY
MLALFLGVIFSYFIGSIPIGFIAGKAIKNVDLREVGSGNPGATNVYRTLGLVPAILVFALDVLKGLIPVIFFPAIFLQIGGDSLSIKLIYQIVLGLMAIAGHVWSIFLSFKGGKGVGTAFGVFLGLAPAASLLALAVWCVVVGVMGIVSLGSLSAAVCFPFFLLLTKHGILEENILLLFFGTIVTILVVYTHRANIMRLIRREEKSFKKKKGEERSE